MLYIYTCEPSKIKPRGVLNVASHIHMLEHIFRLMNLFGVHLFNLRVMLGFEFKHKDKKMSKVNKKGEIIQAQLSLPVVASLFPLFLCGRAACSAHPARSAHAAHLVLGST